MANGSGRLVWIDGWKLIQDGDEFVQECLTLQTEQQMLEVMVGEIRHPAAVGPQLHRGNVKIFFPHIILDCRITFPRNLKYALKFARLRP